MSGVVSIIPEAQIPPGCIQCPCEELKKLMEEMSILKTSLSAQGTWLEGRIDKTQLDSAKDRARILRLETDILKLKDSLCQVSAVKTDGTWGIAQKRGDIIYARLFSMKKENGKIPFLTTGDIKKILGVANYSQAKSALSECLRKHLDCRMVERGRKRIGIEIMVEVPVNVVTHTSEKKKW